MSSTCQHKTNSKFEQDTNFHLNTKNVLTIMLSSMKFRQEKQGINSWLFKSRDYMASPVSFILTREKIWKLLKKQILDLIL